LWHQTAGASGQRKFAYDIRGDPVNIARQIQMACSAPISKRGSRLLEQGKENDTMKFYDCSTAPSPRLVRVFIAEKGIEIPVQQVDLGHGEHLADEFRAINPYCTVPVLELDDGTRLTSTQGCWRYLEETVSEPALLGTTPAEKAIVADRVWRIECDGWQAMTEALRNSTPRMKDRALPGPDNYAQIPALGERGKLRTERFLARLDAMLEDGPYLAGERYTAADIMALVLVDFAGWLKIGLPEDATRARRWYQTVSARPSAKL
jgi:glutathione S-transferase